MRDNLQEELREVTIRELIIIKVVELEEKERLKHDKRSPIERIADTFLENYKDKKSDED